MSLDPCGQDYLKEHVFTQILKIPPSGKLEFKLAVRYDKWYWGQQHSYEFRPGCGSNPHGNRHLDIPPSKVVVVYAQILTTARYPSIVKSF